MRWMNSGKRLRQLLRRRGVRVGHRRSIRRSQVRGIRRGRFRHVAGSVVLVATYEGEGANQSQ